MQEPPRSEDDKYGCPECGAEITSFVFGQECTECDWSHTATPEPPEGGWPRGSDMDRI